MKNTPLKLLPVALLSSAASFSAFATQTDLSHLYDLAIEHDPLLSQVRIQQQIAAENVTLSQSSLLPQLSAFFSSAYLKDNRNVEANLGGSGTSVALGMRVSQALYTPAVSLAIDIAKQDQSKAQTLIDKATSALALRVSNAYFDVLRANEQLSVVSATRDGLLEVKKQTEKRVALGLVSTLDLQEAQSQYDLASANIIFAQAQYDSALDALYTLTGQSFSSVNEIDLSLFAPALPQPAYGRDWEESALTRNFDVRLASESVAISLQQVRLASSGHKPTVVLFGGINQELLMDIDDVGGNTAAATRMDNLTELDIGIRADLPIYSGGRTSSQVEIAKKGVELAQSIQEQSRRNVIESIRSTERFTRASLKSINAYDTALSSAKATLDAVEQGYQIGSRTMAEVLDANTRYYRAQNNLNNARFDYINNVLTLKYYAGELDSSDIQTINAGLVAQQQK